MADKNGGLAFPANTAYYNSPGMTLRDYMAGQALTNYIDFTPRCDMSHVAKHCYAMADEMLKERKKLRKASQNE